MPTANPVSLHARGHTSAADCQAGDHQRQQRPFFTIAGVTRKATHFVVKVEIGGLAGLVAPLVGKQPPDSHVWILPGEVPAFLKSEGPLYLGGPIWRIELTSPVWAKTVGPVDAESKK